MTAKELIEQLSKVASDTEIVGGMWNGHIESWSQRKKDLFKREHIQAAYQHLDTWMNRGNKTPEPLNL